MAQVKDKKKSGKNSGATVLEMDKPEESEPISEQTAPRAETPEHRRKPGPGRGHGSDGPTFWEKLQVIPLDDWGARFYVYLYRLEPLIDRLRSGEKKYVMRYEKAVDEETILVEHGSGRYRLVLVCLKPASKESSEMASLDFDLLNGKYPPKVPKGEWLDDPRNTRWAWAKASIDPPVVPLAAGNPAETFMEAVRLTNDIRGQVREELVPAETEKKTSATSTIADFTGLVGAVKTLMPAPPPATDNKMLETVVSLLQSQIAASNQEAQQLRAQVFQLITDRKNEKPTTSALDVVKGFIDEADNLIPKIRGLFTATTDGVTSVVHGRPRKWWEDSLVKLAEGAAPLIPQVGARLLAPPRPAMQVAPQIAAPGQQPQPSNPANDAALRLMGLIQRPRLVQKLQEVFTGFMQGKTEEGVPIDGEDFAIWLHDAHGEEPLKDLQLLGTGNVLVLMKQQPWWQLVAAHEAKMQEFLSQILQFQPELEDEPDGDETDLTAGAKAPQGVN